MSDFPSDEQREAIEWNKGHACVVAIPGSGKTAVLVAKVIRLLASGFRVAAVTFTRSAADELRRRVRKEVSGEALSRFKCGTFHRFVLDALEAMPSSPLCGRRIADKQEVVDFMQQALDCAGLKPTKQSIDELALSQARVTDPYRIQDAKKGGANSSQLSRAIALQEAGAIYSRLTLEAGVMDLQQAVRTGLDHVIDGLDLFDTDYLLVDEAQDVDEVQLAMLIHQARWLGPVMLVGDDDQSVYKFREGLGYTGLKNFREATGAEILRLSENFRCRKEILDAAALVIEENDERLSKRLIARKGPGGSIRLISFDDNLAEAKGVATWVIALAEKKVGDIAVIARTNRHLDTIEGHLKGRVEYFRALDDDFWDSPVPGTVVSFLRCLADRREVAGFIQVLRLWGVQSSDIELLKSCSPDGTLRGTVRSEGSLHGNFSAFTMSAVNALRMICRAAWNTVADQDQRAIDKMLEDVSEQFILYYELLAADRGEREERIDATCRTLATAFGAVRKFSGSLVRRIAAIKSRRFEPTQKPAVHLATMHASKGLEFEHVFVVGCEHQTIPREDASENQRAEERRLLYVAMTRAKEQLVISFPKKVIRNDLHKCAWCTELLKPVKGLKVEAWEKLQEPWREFVVQRARRWWSTC